MANTSLPPDLVELTQQLAETFAQSQTVIAAKARIGLFYQNAEASNLFRKINEFGEELRNKSMSGMQPSDEEIAQFDGYRKAVIENECCKGFLDARQTIDGLISTVSQYLGLAIDLGRAPSDEEVANAMNQSMSASCACGDGCSSNGNCDDCESCESKP